MSLSWYVFLKLRHELYEAFLWFGAWRPWPMEKYAHQANSSRFSVMLVTVPNQSSTRIIKDSITSIDAIESAFSCPLRLTISL